MAGKKFSIYLAEEITGIVESTWTLVDDRREGSLSGRLSNIVSRYDRIVREHAPSLTLAEWCAVCDANNGTMMDIEGMPDESRWMWANVADTKGLNEKWEISQDKLVHAMRGWTYAESMSCAEIVGRFWANCERTDNEQLLRECGAKIDPEADEPKKTKKRKE